MKFVHQAFPHSAYRYTSGESGIRTHAPLRTNGFQDRLVMTTSISLQTRLTILSDKLLFVKHFFIFFIFFKVFMKFLPSVLTRPRYITMHLKICQQLFLFFSSFFDSDSTAPVAVLFLRSSHPVTKRITHSCRSLLRPGQAELLQSECLPVLSP